jgi:hypothetical protein
MSDSHLSEEKTEPVEPVRDPATWYHGYAVLMNVQSIPDASGTEIVPGLVVRRAQPDEIDFIKKSVDLFGVAFEYQRYCLWEQETPPYGHMLPVEKWRYFIVAFKGFNDKAMALSKVFAFSNPELMVGFSVITSGSSRSPMWNGARLFHAFEYAQHNPWTLYDVTSDDMASIASLYSSFVSHNHAIIDLNRIVDQMVSLNGLPYQSPLRFLGYFALLESLLTHAPDPKDTIDSITRQVKKKLALLNSRFVTPIDYSQFKGADSDKIWATMYSYRSAVAHGSTPDFEKNLKLLKGHSEALNLLRETMKALIRHAMVDPKLLVDLREC